MSSFSATLLLIIVVECIWAKYIPDTNNVNTVEWFPQIVEDKPRIASEFSWLYLQKKESLLDLNLNLINFKAVPFNLDDVFNLTAFYLYTEKNKHAPHQLIIDDLSSVKSSHWDPARPTKIIMHGYVATYKDEYVQIMKDKILDLEGSVNVILFDWGPIANFNYPRSASVSDKVGAVCSLLIDFLCLNTGSTPNQFHIIGHSLGAHIAGFAGKYTTVGQVGRVTGLDPAYPGFITVGKDGRLDASDAEFVDCIHTCGGWVSFHAPICHADYYPNGGVNPQPGCTGFFQAVGCSHSRAHELFTESIVKGHQFPALTCPDLPKKNSVKCVEQGATMGYPAQNRFKGIFYAITNQVPPFAPNITFIL